MRHITKLALIAILTSTLYGQQDMGVITGTVTDMSNAPVKAAKVIAVNQDTNETRETATTLTGSFTIGPLRIGSYKVSVEKLEFQKATSEVVELHAQDRARLNFQLQLAEMASNITVTAEAPVLQSETSSVEHVVQQREMREVPLNGRNFQQLAWQTAGIVPNPRSQDRESGFNAHGQPVTQNNFLIDGIDNNNQTMGMQDRKMQVVVPSLDAVAEFKIQTSNYSAEFGRSSGAVMIVNLKSGGNHLHGTAYEYLRNDFFDARDTFSYIDRNGDGKADPAILKQNQFGATLGGPVRRDKTFFFGSYEGRTQRQGQLDLSIVPTEAERTGLFSTAIKDPLTGQAFANRQIPVSRFDPTAAKMLELWPGANYASSGARQNYSRYSPWSTDRRQIDFRVDHNLGLKDTLFGRISLAKLDSNRAGAFDAPGRGSDTNDRSIDDNSARSAVLSETHVFTPAVVNELRVGYSYQAVNRGELSQESLSTLAGRYGIKGIPENTLLKGLPFFTFTGTYTYSPLGEVSNTPNLKDARMWQFLDNVSWTLGRHTFKTGVDLRRNFSNVTNSNFARGGFQFNGSFTGNAFADFLLGYAYQAQLASVVPGDLSSGTYMAYVQDDWKLSPKLTLNLGARYELFTPEVDSLNRMTTLDLNPGPTYGAVIKAGDCGSSIECRALVSMDKNNIAPRLGLAYQFSPKAVLRLSAGTFYGSQVPFGVALRPINNFPFNRNSQVQASNTTQPVLQLSSGLPADFLGTATTPPANSNWSVWDRHREMPMVYQWSASLQRELSRDATVSATYVGSSSSYINGNYNYNGSGIGPLATEQARRPLPQYGTITYLTQYGHSTYHGLELVADRRFARGLSFHVAYTWSHSLDNVNEQFGNNYTGTLQSTTDFASAKGNSGFDVRHRVVGGWLYDLPFGQGHRLLNVRSRFGDALVSGWQLSGLYAKQSGIPFTPTVSNSRNRLGATAIGTWWPDRVSSGVLSNPTLDRWFDTSAFVLPRNADGSFRYGNAGRGILRTDGLRNLDLSLAKMFRLRESLNLQFRAESFNLTNTPTYGLPEINLDSPDFGKVRTTDNTPRNLQFALRLIF